MTDNSRESGSDSPLVELMDRFEKSESRYSFYEAKDKEISETQIKKILSERYGGDCSTRDLVKNERIDDHGTVGSVVYSLSGSPPKGYAIFTEGHAEVWFIDAFGAKFAEVANVFEVLEE